MEIWGVDPLPLNVKCLYNFNRLSLQPNMNAMPAPLHLLILENKPEETELVLDALRKSGYTFDYVCVQDKAELISALEKQVDLILAISAPPHTSAMSSLDFLKLQHLDIPFIFIPLKQDDELIMQAMEKGASDCIPLQKLEHLGSMLNRALVNKRLRLKNQQVQKALYEREVILNQLVQQSFDGIVLCDGEGRIIEWSASMEQITGLARDGALDSLFWDIIFQLQLPELKTEANYKHTREAFLQAIEEKSAPWFNKPDVCEIQHLDGSRKFIESITFPVQTGDFFLLGSILRDVSERIRAESEVRRHIERVEALLRLTKQLNAQLNMETVLNIVCRETTLAIQASLTVVLLYDPVKDHLVQGANYCTSKDNPIHIPPIPLAVFESYAPSAQPATVLHDLQLQDEWQLSGLHEQLDARSAVFLKMSHARRFVGFLAVYALGEERHFSKDELTLLTGFSNQAAVAIYNAWLFEQVDRGRKNLKALSRRLVDIQEDERRSIARELHDEIGQALTGLKMLFETMPELPPPVTERIQMGRQLVVELVERTRRISLDLRPSMLDDLGLLPALLWHIQRCQEQSLLEIDLKHAGLDRRFSPSIETAAYRIIQEGCTNIIRHAQVERAWIRVWVDEDALNIKVEDHGAGFDSRSIVMNGSAGGLSGMQERAVLVGGILEIHSQPSEGTTLIARLPLQDHLERRVDARS
jgi:PAS domain S-box-containing protein